MRSFEFRFSEDIAQSDQLTFIESLNRDRRIHGVLVQLPLPQQIDVGAVLEAIDSAKDVGGFNPLNVGRLPVGGEGLIPCTPLGCMKLLKTVHPTLAGLRLSNEAGT